MNSLVSDIGTNGEPILHGSRVYPFARGLSGRIALISVWTLLLVAPAAVGVTVCSIEVLT